MQLFALLAGLLLAGSMAPPAQDAVVQRRLGAMGTWLELEVAAPSRGQALQASEAAVRAIEAVEQRLSTWREDSELARLNRAPAGEAWLLSAELRADLERARRLCLATDGAFDPGVGALVVAWGLRTGGRRPTGAELAAALAPGGLAGLALDGACAVRPAGLSLEEGAFGKGVGLDAACAELARHGATWATVDLGGQIVLQGAQTASPARRFGVADPRARERVVLELEIASGSLATSGNSERGIVVDGERRAHILDPRTGIPVRDFGSLTVWAPDATTADALSTALYVLGPEAALTWAARHSEVEVVVLSTDEDGRLSAHASAGLRARLHPVVDDLHVTLTTLTTRTALTALGCLPPR